MNQFQPEEIKPSDALNTTEKPISSGSHGANASAYKNTCKSSSARVIAQKGETASTLRAFADALSGKLNPISRNAGMRSNTEKREQMSLTLDFIFFMVLSPLYVLWI